MSVRVPGNNECLGKQTPRSMSQVQHGGHQVNPLLDSQADLST